MSGYNPAEITKRERLRKKQQRRQVVGLTIAGTLICGNIALFVFRDTVMSWVKENFGTVTVTIDKDEG